LVLVPFHVIRNQQLVRTLTASDITILEDGEEREISIFDGGPSGRSKIPQEVLLLFDVAVLTPIPFSAPDVSIFKSSLLDLLASVRLAVYADDNLFMPFCPPTRDYTQFAKAFGLMVQCGRVSPDRLIEPPDRSRAAAAASTSQDPVLGVKNIPPPAGSISLDYLGELKRHGLPRQDLALLAALKTAAAWPGDTTRSVMVFSRGLQWSHVRVEDVLARARQFGISLYPVSVEASRIPSNVDQMDVYAGRILRGLQALMGLGEATGGRAFAPIAITTDTAREILAGLADRLRAEYVAGFEAPPSSDKPEQHRVEVRLRSEQLGVITGGTRVVMH
jgi:hypothetical protein